MNWRLVAFVVLAGAIGGTASGDDRYPPASFGDLHEGSLNISVFTFRDLNRNGRHDLGDLPMAGLLVDATSEGLPEVTRRSNGSGFANFEMSATDLRSDIPLAGSYTFSVAVPDGWSVTTGNAVQDTRFVLLPGAPADMFADPPPLPVGLAPDLTISGRVEKGTGSLQATSPSGETTDIAITDRRFAIEAAEGTWILAFDGPDGLYTRTVDVTAEPVVLAGTGRAGSTSQPNQTVDFEGLVPAEITKVPSGYHGLDWQNFVAAYWKFYSSEGYRNALMSGTFVAYNGSGQPAVVSSDAPFDFVGGYIGLGSLTAEGETLNIRAWRGDELVHQEQVILSALGPTYFLADFNGITRLQFQTAHYWQAIFDDLEFRVPAAE